MKIAIITDGNNELGLGHVYQSLTLANALKEQSSKSLRINFMTKSDEGICQFIHSSGYDVEHFDHDELIFEKLQLDQPDRIIFDKLDVSPCFAAKIKEILKIKLIISTNLTEANRYADIAVFPDFGSNFKNIVNKNYLTGRVEFFGLKYWLLRPEFYAFKKKVKTHNDTIKNIMLMFGGSDPANLSTFVLRELLQIDFEFNILLVLGSAFNHTKELSSILDKNKISQSKVSIVNNITNVAEEMYKSDVVFASPGLSFSEALVVGTPVVGFHQNEPQRKEYADVLPTLGLDDLYKLPLIIKNKSFVFPDDPLIQSMEIGEGKDEIINAILN